MAEFTELKNGMPLGGGYVLGDFIRPDGTSAFFRGSAGAGEQLLIKLVAGHDPEAGAQFRAWERMRTLNHAHLQSLRDAGAGTRYLYAVLEPPDDVLASALDRGPLSEAETRGVLEAALAGLRHLHGQGLVHGAVDAEHVIAVGETVKLATDGLRVSDDRDAQGEDLRQLGELVRRLRAPEPLGPSLERMLAGTTPAPVTPMPAPVAPPPREEVAVPSGGGYAKWILAAVAAIAVCVLLFVWSGQTEPAPVKHKVQEASRMAPEPAAKERRPTPFPDSRPAAPAVEAPVAAARSAAAAAPQRGEWRVVAFTYRSHEIAAKKAAQINGRWPDLGAEVFEPKDGRGYSLVTLGGWMKRADAELLQRRARSLGLPPDTYTQNYAQ